MTKLFIVTLILLSVNFSYSEIKNVPGNYATIQSAINASSNGDTILTEPGTYTENINFRGKNIVLTSRFYLNFDLSYISSTIINGSNPAHPDTASCVIISSGEDSSAVLQGFTITGGTGTKWMDIHGAGRYNEGGGILIELASPIIRFNIIRNNSALINGGVTSAGGGGIRIGDGNPKIYNNVITYNTALYGAGIVLNYTGVQIKNNIISSNYGSNAYGAGSGIWCIANLGTLPKIIENNTIVNNSASLTSGTGGIYIGQANYVTIKNNNIWGNTANSSLTQIIQSRAPVINYNNIMNGWSSGIGNVNIQPQFSDTNYVLSVSSGCIDKGDTSVIYNDPGISGIAQYPSRGTTRNDLGAYGGPGAKILSSSPIGINTNIETAGEFRLDQNYPNPFNPVTNIKFEIRAAEYAGRTVDVRLVIYNSLGQEIETLVDNELQAGAYEVKFGAHQYTSGIYFYSLIVNENVFDTKKMILIK